jgi:hypothetical protein
MGHVGQGWRKISFPTNAHLAEVEQQLGGGSRSALIALAVSAFQEGIEDYTAYKEHLYDYGVHVAPQGNKRLTSIHLTDETEADLQAIGAAFERKGWLQLLKGTTGYNRRLLIYMALRWYADQLTISERMC